MTAEEFRVQFYGDKDSRAYDVDEASLMIQFAQHHAKKALEVAAETADFSDWGIIDRDAILNSYNLEDIK